MNLYTFIRSASDSVENEVVGIAAHSVEEAIELLTEMVPDTANKFMQIGVREIHPGVLFINRK